MVKITANIYTRIKSKPQAGSVHFLEYRLENEASGSHKRISDISSKSRNVGKIEAMQYCEPII